MTLRADAWLFPRGGVFAPGPLGQVEYPNALPRAWADQVPPARPIALVRLMSGEDLVVTVDGPRLCRLTATAGSLAGSAWSVVVSPERRPGDPAAPPFSGFQGIPSSRDTFLLPSAGTWIIRAVGVP